jgi:20S proteasome alpha/beta subunit
MTTLVGIRTNEGLGAIVLASDTQMVYFDDSRVPIGKRPMYKLNFGEFWAMGHTGVINSDLRRFYDKLKDTKYAKEAIERAITKKRFIEVDELNANYMKNQGDRNSCHEFLLAVNKPSLLLFHVDDYGNLLLPGDEEDYIILGSGETTVKDYLEEKTDSDDLDAGKIDLRAALGLVRGSLKKAEKEIDSGGSMDFIVIRDNKINAYGRRLRKAVFEAEDIEFKRIVSEETQ